MNQFAQIILIATIPAILLLFANVPPRRAVILSFIISWLALPNRGFPLMGLPDLTKITATTYGTLLGAFAFDMSRMMRYRFRWYDLPMLVWIATIIPSYLSNGLTLYDGFSAVLAHLGLWGIPYLLGRVYLDDLEGLREFGVAVVAGALLYVPFCLFEIKFGPVLQDWIYGVRPVWMPPRWHLGFRPVVFLASGLETSMWLTIATLIAYWFWTTDAVKKVLGYPIKSVLVVIAGMTFLTKSLGAISLLAFGLSVLWLTRRTKSPVFILLLTLVPAGYMNTRSTGYWSGMNLVEAIRPYDVDRAMSFQVRLENENILIAKALQRPLLGWGGFGRNRVLNKDFQDVCLTDGFWVITLGVSGMIGLVCQTLIHTLPSLILLRRYPARLWSESDVAPAAVFAMVVVLYMIDNLSNAFFTPIYVLAAAGVMSLNGARGRTSGSSPGLLANELAGRLELAMTLQEAGHVEDAEQVYVDLVRALEPRLASGESITPAEWEGLAVAHGSLASLDLSRADGAHDRALACLERAVELRRSLVAAHPGDPAFLRAFAVECENLGRVLWAEGRFDEADEHWTMSLDLRRELIGVNPESDSSLIREWADAQNDLAWILARQPRPGSTDSQRALELAESALQTYPDSPSYANTLGVARFALGDHAGAVEALARSLEGQGENPYDHYVLAMAYRYLGDLSMAMHHFQRGEACPDDGLHHLAAEIAHVRQSAADLLEVPSPALAQG